MGLFSSKKPKASGGKVLTKNYAAVLKNLKKTRIDEKHRSNRSLNEIGKDLALIERKAREFYNFTARYVKEGHSQNDAYHKLLTNHASSDIDRSIIERLFIDKK